MSIDLVSGYGIKATEQDGVITILLNRPEAKNCFAPEDYQRLGDLFIELSTRDDIQVIVMRGAGDAFTTGGDLVVKQRAIASGGAFDLFTLSAKAATRAFESLEQCNALVISAIDGFCFASGVSLALSSDLSVATTRSLFKVPEGLVGVADPFIATRLPIRVGMTRARWLIYSAQQFDSAEALEWGVVNEVVPPEQLNERLDEIIEMILCTAPNSRSEYKQALASILPPLDTSVMLRANISEFALEGINAFAERRKPQWDEAAARERARRAALVDSGN